MKTKAVAATRHTPTAGHHAWSAKNTAAAAMPNPKMPPQWDVKY